MNATTIAAPTVGAPTLDTPTAKRAADRPAAEPVPHVWTPPRKRIRSVVLIVLLAAGALLAILTAWNLPPFGGGVEKTDNAYVRGLTMSVAPQVSGYVVGVDVRDYEQVHTGQVLA